MRKRAGLIAALAAVAALCVTAFVGCSGGKFGWVEEVTHLEYGEVFAVPDAAKLDKEGNPVSEATELESVEGPDGAEVSLSFGGSFLANQKGTYVFRYGDKVIEAECKDTKTPVVEIEAEEKYAVKDYGADAANMHTYPFVRAGDVSGIDESKTTYALTLDGENVPLGDGRTFSVNAEGTLEFSVYVEDKDGNGKTYTASAVAYLPGPPIPDVGSFEDEDIADDSVLSDFDEDGYLINVSNDPLWIPNNGSFKAEMLESDSDGTATHYGVMKVTYAGLQEEACLRIYLGRPVKRSEISAIRIVMRAVNCEKPKPADPGNLVIYGKSSQDGYWTVPGVNPDVSEEYRTVEVRGSEVLDNMADEDGFIRSIAVETFQSADRVLYFAEISFAGIPVAPVPFGDDNLAAGLLADFDEEEYKNNIVRDIGASGEMVLTALASDSDGDNAKSGVLKIAYPGMHSHELFELRFGKKILRSEVGKIQIVFRIENHTAQGGGFLFFKDKDISPWEGIPVTNGTEKWQVMEIGGTMLDKLAEDDGYIYGIYVFSPEGQLAEDRKADRTVYLAEVSYTAPTAPVTPYEDGALEEGVLADFTEAEYAGNIKDNPWAGNIVVGPFEPEVLSSHSDGTTTYDGVLKVTYPGEQGERSTRLVFGAPVLRAEAESITVTFCGNNLGLDPAGFIAIFFGSGAPWENPATYTVWGEESDKDEWRTLTISDSAFLDGIADSDGYIRGMNIETITATDREMYFAEVSYTPVSAEPLPFEDEDIAAGLLADFDEAGYENNFIREGNAVGEMNVEVLPSATDGTTEKQGVLKVSYPGEHSHESFELRFGRKILRAEVEELWITVRVVNPSFQGADNRCLAFYAKGSVIIWDSPAVTDGTGTWQTVRIGADILDDLVETDGYIYGIYGMSFEGAKVPDREIYIAEVGYTAPTVPFADSALAAGLLADFDEADYRNNVANQGGSAGEISAEVLDSVTDSASEEKSGVLKVVYPSATGNEQARLTFGKEIARADVTSVVITLRFEGVVAHVSGEVIKFFGDGHENIWVGVGLRTTGDGAWLTATIDGDHLDKIADRDGVIRGINFITFENAAGREIYIAEVAYA